MAVLSIEGLSKRYGPRLAVDGVDFEVRANEVLGLLGPNGSGKSTILRLVTGYLRPSAGTARVAGFDVVRDGVEARRRIGYVPEGAPLYGHMRVVEFLGFMGRLRGLSGAALDRAVALAIERLQLGAVRDAVIDRLSHGFRQRVSLAQAVLHEPELLVLDEPSNGLDPRQIIELRGLVRGLARHCAVLVTSHILTEIERVADRVAILLDGRLLTIERIDRDGSGRSLLIEAPAAEAARVAGILAACPGIDAITPEPAAGTARWRARVAGQDGAARLRAALAEAGIAVVEVAEPPSRLEALFLDLTRAKAAS